MNKVVFGNLCLLDVYLSNQRLISEGNELSLIGKEDYDTVEKLSSLEYPIYFTYHELLNNISYNKDLSYSKKRYLLDKISESLDILIQYIDDYEEENSKICFIIDNIYERYELVKSQTIYTWGEKAIFLFDDLVDSFRNASKYLYFTPTLYPLMYLKPGETFDDESECASDSSQESDSDYDDGSGEETNYVEVCFEGVEYLEDEDTSNIYTASHELVGKWNEDGDVIIWKSSKFKKIHDSLVNNKSTLNSLD